jgi:exonuclease, DNA polymerase III, epsilon subunit family
MDELIIKTKQIPGVVTFENYEEVKSKLERYIKNNFDNTNYEIVGLIIAEKDYKELKAMRDIVSKKQKELKKAYSAPFEAVDKMLSEILEIIDVPYKRAYSFVDTAGKNAKKQEVMAYAYTQAKRYGDVGKHIVESPAFYNKSWSTKSASLKGIHDAVDEKIKQATKDITSIQSTGGNNIPVLMARFYETLSMDGVKSFLSTLSETQNQIDDISIESDNNVLGYKILKITATEDQMVCIMDQLELMGAEVEEIEDGMPKAMEELTIPDFNSFVAFDIETTGTNGVANGDGEAQIVEIGAVRVIDGVITDRFNQLANPGRKIVPRISRLTHITDEMVVDKPPVSDVIKMFFDFVGDNTLIGHNIKSSDLRYIIKAANKAGVHLDVPFLDTYVLARKYKEQKGWEKLKLEYLSEYYGLAHKEAHRAWSDAEVNALVYFELKKLSEEH